MTVCYNHAVPMRQLQRTCAALLVAVSLFTPVIANALAFTVGDALRITDANMQLPTVEMAWVDDTRMIVLYAESGEGFLRIVTRDGSTLSNGTAYSLGTGIFRGTVTMLDDTHAVISYADEGDGRAGKAVIATITGTSIALGTPVTFEDALNGTSNYAQSATRLDATHFVLSYPSLEMGLDMFGDPGETNSGVLIVGAVSGTNITFGSSVVYSNDAVGAQDVTTLDSSHVVVTYEIADGTFALVASVSDTTVTTGTPVQYADGSDFNQNDALDSSHFIVAYQGGDDGQGRARIGVVSGTDITFGAVHEFSPMTSGAISVTAIDPASAVIVYDDFGGGTRGTVTIASISGNTITTADPTVFGTSINGSSTVAFDEETVMIGYYSNEDNKGYVRLAYRDLPSDSSSSSSSSSPEHQSHGGGRRGGPGRGGTAPRWDQSRIISPLRPAASVRESMSKDMETRTCERVMKWFKGDAKMLGRVNDRLEKRFGFNCR